jgi:hypothetical protein
LELISDSAEDDPDKGAGVPGTGAHSVYIAGLDTDWNPLYEVITLNGAAAVAGTKEFLRINHAIVLTVGTGGTNAGNITIRDASAGTTRSYIAAARGASEDGVYSVAADHQFALDGWYLTARDASGASYADVDFRERHNATGGAFHDAWSVNVEKTFIAPFYLPHPFPAKSDIEMRVTGVSANNTIVSFHGHGLLVGPNADL